MNNALRDLRESISHVRSSQEDIIADIRSTRNSSLITGGPGTGKSFIIKQLLTTKEMGPISVLAPSASAARAFKGGMTIHSFVGKRKPGVRKSFTVANTNLIIIDEISMVQPRLFQELIAYVTHCRLQWGVAGHPRYLLFGDFNQLPPVCKHEESDVAGRYCSITRIITHAYELKKNYRFDNGGLSMLSEVVTDSVIRKGFFEALSARVYNGCWQQYIKKVWINERERVFLASTNARCRSINKFCSSLACVNGEKMIYPSLTLPIGTPWANIRASFLDGVTTFIGERIVVTQNSYGKDLCNGDFAVVTGFTEGSYPVVTAHGGASDIFHRYPLVRKNDSGKSIVMTYHEKSVLRDSMPEVRKFNIPITAGWATTVHKAQGRTIEKLALQVDGFFQREQLYVALTRTRRLSDIDILGNLVDCLGTLGVEIGGSA